MELLWHGSTPFMQPNYPTAEESKSLHDRLKFIVGEALASAGVKVVSSLAEYQYEIGFRRGDVLLCARSKADLIYTLSFHRKLVNLYIEVSSTRINVAKPWQALLRGIALYYEWRLPVGIVIVSPGTIMYKLLEDLDQDKVLWRIRRTSENYKSSPDLCSLCELASYCPYKVI